MSTRIVERDLSWCRTEVENFLIDENYCLDGTKKQDEQLKGEYAGPENKRMLYKPLVEVHFLPVSTTVTSLAVFFPTRWGLGAFLATLWSILGWGPFILLESSLFEKMNPGLPWWMCFAGIAGWGLFVMLRFLVKVLNTVKHELIVEKLLWDRLDAQGSISYEVSAHPGREFNFGVCKWGSFCLAIFICGLLIKSGLEARGKPKEEIAGFCMLAEFLFLILLLLLLWVWIGSFFVLPHRYHWKARFAIVFVGSWLLTCFPIMALVLISSMRALRYWQHGEVVMSGGAKSTVLLLILIDVILPLMLLLVCGSIMAAFFGYYTFLTYPGSSKNYLEPMSTKYESFTEETVNDKIQANLKLNNNLTWAVFVCLTVLWYMAVVYVVVILLEAVAGSFGAEWALAQYLYWPLIVPTDGVRAALQTVILVSLFVVPLALIIIKAVRGILNKKSRLKLGLEFVKGQVELRLPQPPLDFLKQQLGSDNLWIALVPVPEIDMQLERIGILKKRYLLWISVGARKRLSKEEMEALLWHECGHIKLVRRTGRELVARVSLWAPRFLDLLEDLYEEERQADFYAVRKMATRRHLEGALHKVKKDDELLKNRECKAGYSKKDQLSWAQVKGLWNLGWAGYVHPDIEQRLRWLEENE